MADDNRIDIDLIVLVGEVLDRLCSDKERALLLTKLRIMVENRRRVWELP